MNIDNLDIKKDGSLTIGSIFELSGLNITLLIDKCRRVGCTLHFENEDLTIDDTYDDDPGMRAKVMLYTLLAGHPEAALDYINFLYKKETSK